MNDLATIDSVENLASSFELGTLEKILLQTKNDEAIADIDNQLEDLNAILGKLSKHTLGLIEGVENPDNAGTRRMNTKEKPRVSNMYITAQTGNLISLINAKASMLKQKNDLRTSGLDRAYKILAQISKERMATQGGSELPLDQILTYLMRAGVTVPISPNNPSRVVMDETITEDDIDAELMDAIAEYNIPAIRLNAQGNPISEEEYQRTMKDKEQVITVIEDDSSARVIFYATEEGKIYLTTEDYTVIREIEEDELDIEERDDGTFFCNNFNLPIESDEEDVEE